MLDHVTDEALGGLIEEQGAAGEIREGAEVERGAGTLELLETYEGEQINSDAIFANEGLDVRRKPLDKGRLAKVAKVYAETLKGRVRLSTLMEATRDSYVASRLVQETMMSSEFSTLLGSSIDRVLLAQYATYAPGYRRFMKVRMVPDFRSVGSVRRSGGRGLVGVAEGSTYPQAYVSEESYTYSVSKYGMTYSLTWESIVNDDLDAFASMPRDMADDAVQEEMAFATSLYVANSTLYAASHDSLSDSDNSDTAALTLANLIAGYNKMLKFPGEAKEDGTTKALNNMPRYLVIPPGLALTAKQILASDNLLYGGDEELQVGASNPMAGMLEIIIDPYLANTSHTGWYLFADPARVPAVEVGFLRGHEQPQVFRKAPNQNPAGSGENFDDDTYRWKIRHVFGGSHAEAAGGWRGTYYSSGAG